jgi:hypothetical protein
MAWKKEITQTKVLKAGCGYSSSCSSVILLKIAFVLSFKPSGGSVTTFNDFYNNPRGNSLVG